VQIELLRPRRGHSVPPIKLLLEDSPDAIPLTIKSLVFALTFRHQVDCWLSPQIRERQMRTGWVHLTVSRTPDGSVAFTPNCGKRLRSAGGSGRQPSPSFNSSCCHLPRSHGGLVPFISVTQTEILSIFPVP